MTFLTNLSKKLLNRNGQGLVEYALILILIAVVVFAAVALLGGTLNTKYGTISSSLP